MRRPTAKSAPRLSRPQRWIVGDWGVLSTQIAKPSVLSGTANGAGVTARSGASTVSILITGPGLAGNDDWDVHRIFERFSTSSASMSAANSATELSGGMTMTA